eukprot:scaffold42991_cov20-Tisochrysis_lutea.AAC.4
MRPQAYARSTPQQARELTPAHVLWEAQRQVTTLADSSCQPICPVREAEACSHPSNMVGNSWGFVKHSTSGETAQVSPCPEGEMRV